MGDGKENRLHEGLKHVVGENFSLFQLLKPGEKVFHLLILSVAFAENSLLSLLALTFFKNEHVEIFYFEIVKIIL